MTATDELRRMLDERGVKWCPSAWDRSTETYWKTADGNGCLATQGETKLRLSFADYLTPEQAIEATLGRGTCRIRGGECDQCGAYIHRDAVLFWVPVGEGMKTVESRDVRYCPICGAKVVDDASVD